MPRGGGGGSRSSGRSSAPAPSRAAPPPARAPPPPAAPAPQQQQMMAPAAPQSGGMLSGLGSTLAQGFAFGTGSALARRAVDSVMGGNDKKEEVAPQQQAAPAAPAAPKQDLSMGACKWDFQAFNDCMKTNNNDATSCEFYYNALKQCKVNNSSV